MKKVYICDKCAKEYLRSYQCECGKDVNYLEKDFIANARVRDMVRLSLCLECYCKRRREAFEEAFENSEHLSLFSFSPEAGERVLREILAE
jgi:hypothetical protein